MRYFHFVLLGTFITALHAQNTGFQDADAGKQKKQRMEWMVESVSDIAMSLDDETKLSLRKEPLLRWSNPVSGINDGTVFMWTHGKRPHAAAQVFRVPDGTWLQEYQSLSPQPILARRDGKTLWSPQQPGVKMLAIPEVPRPATTPTGRLAQMRAIARQFTASDQFEDRESYELRLLSRPLHRYGAPDDSIVDGGLFTFTHGTDPEVLVLIEARQVGREFQWRIGFAPLTSYAIEVRHKGTVFWECDRRPPPNQVTDTFFLHVQGKGP